MTEKDNSIVFDPSKSYSWDENLTVNITGLEFDTFFKALQSNLQGNLFQSHVLQYEALKVAQSILKRNVEDGTIKEVPTENVEKEQKKKKSK